MTVIIHLNDENNDIVCQWNVMILINREVVILLMCNGVMAKWKQWHVCNVSNDSNMCMTT